RDSPLVVVPTGVLHGVPWGGLASLRGRAVSVSPSLSAWAAAALAAGGARRPVALIAGPALQHADEEIAALATIHDGAVVVPAADSSAEGTGGVSVGPRPARSPGATVGLFATSGLVPLACHGTFRIDNPLFSTLALADG